MKRVAVLGLLLGLANGLAATAVVFVVSTSVPKNVGWFAYAPLNETVAYDAYGFPWEYVVLPVVLVALNALLLPLAVRRGWLQR